MGSEWKHESLGEILEFSRGFDLPQRSRENGDVPIISSAGISGTHSKAKVRGPGVVTGRYGTIGKVFLVNEDYWPLNTTLYVKDFKGNDIRFICYFLRQFDFSSCSDKAAVPGVNRNHLHSLPVVVPPLPEQRAIAHILGTLDDKIECNRRMNETLEKMAQAIFKSWFVDFDPVRWNMDAKNGKAVGKPPVPPEILKLFPDSFQESELGLIPKGWCTKRLEDVLSICETGKRPKGGVSKYKSGVPSIGAESILGLGRFDFSKTKYVPDDFFKEMNKGHISSRDVLLYKDGGKPGLFEPHVSMLGDGFPFCNCAINEHVYRIRSDHYLGQNFLFFWMSSDLVKEEMRIKGTGVAIPGLNSKQLGSIKTLLPTKTCLEIFNSKIDSLVTSILKKSVESRELMDLRDTLLPKLISGELRIKDAEKFIEALS